MTCEQGWVHFTTQMINAELYFRPVLNLFGAHPKRVNQIFLLFNCPLFNNLLLRGPQLLFYSVLCYTLLFCSLLFYSLLFYSLLFNNLLFYSLLFYSLLFHSLLFYYILLFYSLLFHSLLFYSQLLNTSLRYKERCPIETCDPLKWSARQKLLRYWLTLESAQSIVS